MNIYSLDEAIHVLRKLGANNVTTRGSNLRSTCPIHGGSGNLALSAFYNSFGDLRFSCFSHHCCSGVPLEAVARLALGVTPEQSITWLKAELERNDLALEAGTPEVLPYQPKREISLCDESALERLVSLYPYHDYWIKRGYDEAIVAEYRLTYRSIDNKAVIPVFAEQGEFVGMIDRALDGTEPKYKWNSPNSNKGSFLYGVPEALRRAWVVGNRRVVVLVEGTLDVLKLASQGIPAIAAQTNRLSDDQSLSIINNWDAVMVIPDNDEAGEHLIQDSIKRLAPFMDVGITKLAGIKDPDELNPEDVDELKRILIEWSHSWQRRSRKQQTYTLSHHQ